MNRLSVPCLCTIALLVVCPLAQAVEGGEFTVGGAVYRTCETPQESGVAGVGVRVTCESGWSELAITSGVEGSWQLDNVPEENCTVMAFQAAREMCHVEFDGACPPDPCINPVEITVNADNQEENANIDFIAYECFPYDVGGAVYDDCSDPVNSGVEDVQVCVTCWDVFDQCVMTEGVEGLWLIEVVVCGPCTVTATLEGTDVCHIEDDCPPGDCSDSTDIFVGIGDVEENQNIDYFAGSGCEENADCDDGKWCNGDETCNLDTSECEPGTDRCPGPCDEEGDQCVECLNNRDCEPDGLECTDDVCADFVCMYENNCPDEQICTADGCVACDDNSDCDDGLDCTDDTCVEGACEFSSTCPDEEICTEDGCVQCSENDECDDELVCTEDTCVEGACNFENTCSDEAPICTAEGCVACTEDDQCDDGIGCTDDKCIDGSCNFEPNNQNCDDGSACNGSETCDPELDCVAGTDVDCSELDDICNTGVCTEPSGECVKDPAPNEGAECDDDERCTENDVCTAGECVGTEIEDCCAGSEDCPAEDEDCVEGRCRKQCFNEFQCNDLNDCTADACIGGHAGYCYHDSKDDGTACDDLQYCTISEACLNAVCEPGAVNPECVGPPGPGGGNGEDGTDGTDGSDGNDGLSCWDQDADRSCDLPEEDVTGDSKCDIFDCIAFCWDLNGNGTCDADTEDVDGSESCNVLDCIGATGDSGVDGADGADGTDGEDGLSCWDLNGDGVTDPEEDINSDGAWNADDCGLNWSLTIASDPLDPAGEPQPPGIYANDAVVAIPVPNAPGENLIFVRWEGDVPPGEETADPLMLVMDTDKAVTAVFQAMGTDGDGSCPCAPAVPATLAIMLGLIGLKAVGPVRRRRQR